MLPMLTATICLTIAIIAILIYLICICINGLLAWRRALSRPPIGFKDGMVYDTIRMKVLGTRTAVHFDYVTGERFFGKTYIS